MRESDMQLFQHQCLTLPGLFCGLNQWDSRWWSFFQPRGGAKYRIPDIRASWACHGIGAFSLVYKAQLYVPCSFFLRPHSLGFTNQAIELLLLFWLLLEYFWFPTLCLVVHQSPLTPMIPFMPSYCTLVYICT